MTGPLLKIRNFRKIQFYFKNTLSKYIILNNKYKSRVHFRIVQVPPDAHLHRRAFFPHLSPMASPILNHWIFWFPIISKNNWSFYQKDSKTVPSPCKLLVLPKQIHYLVLENQAIFYIEISKHWKFQDPNIEDAGSCFLVEKLAQRCQIWSVYVTYNYPL